MHDIEMELPAMVRNNGEYARMEGFGAARRLNKRNVLDALEAIWRQYEFRLSGRFVQNQQFGLSKNEDAKNFLRREVYALGLVLNQNPPSWDLATFIASTRVHNTTRVKALEGHVFQALLMGVYEEDSPITRQERWIMSKELEYACAHHVPPKFLCGFLYQSGGRANLLKKITAGYIEPAFREPQDVG